MCQGSATLQVLLIPGNPGLASYYLPFLRYLQSCLLPHRTDVFACSYIGHTSQSTAGLAGKAKVLSYFLVSYWTLPLPKQEQAVLYCCTHPCLASQSF